MVRSVFAPLVGRSRCGRELQTRYSCVASVSVASWWCPSCGNTIVAVRLFVAENGYAKLVIALAKGKKAYDKRQSIKEKDIRREMDRSGY